MNKTILPAVCFVATLTVPCSAAADALADLAAVLHRFPASAPFSARATLQARGRSSDVSAARTGSTTFGIECSGKEGLLIRVPPSELQTATKEEQAKKGDAESATPTRTAMVAMTLFDVMDGVDAASMLLDTLDGASLLDRSASSFAGKPATLLRIKVKPTLAGTRSRIVKEPVIELRVWIDGNGIPVAAERESNFSASIVIASASNIRKESWTFAVAGDRLYASRNEQEDRASVAGKTVASWRAVTYAPN